MKNEKFWKLIDLLQYFRNTKSTDSTEQKIGHFYYVSLAGALLITDKPRVNDKFDYPVAVYIYNSKRTGSIEFYKEHFVLEFEKDYITIQPQNIKLNFPLIKEDYFNFTLEYQIPYTYDEIKVLHELLSNNNMTIYLMN